MQRLFFLDNLKSFVVNLMIVFHVGLCYIAAPLPWWYVLDSDLRIEMTYWILDTDMTIMPIMFFISGYFCVKSLAKGKNFWGPKWQRIGIPWLIGIAFLAPVASFLMPYSRGLTADFMTHLTEFYFFNPETGGPGVFYNHVPYWYLGVLMVFYA
ncbi:MAG: acyltransferase family protein, partial [Anaerovibrio sp.]|nr:acyltransferase family protein [Anaerovibrio sp.]